MSQLEAFLSSIKECQTITFSSQNPMIKTLTLSIIVDEFLSSKQQVQYVDLDLQYSSMFTNSLDHRHLASETLQMFRSRDLQTVDLVISLLNSQVRKGGIIVVDSINTLQMLLHESEHRIDFVKSNHEAAILITLIQEFACRYSKALILANVMRSRPRKGQDFRLWDMELSGGRVIKFKSDVILSVSRSIDKLQNDKIWKVDVAVESVLERNKGAFKEGQSFTFTLRSFT
ncbi:MAG: hypothetical protein PXY39_01400 [archaeon]|nr:hypothetical protein [archaeon]